MSAELARAAPRPDILKSLLRTLVTSSAFYLANLHTSFKASVQASYLQKLSFTFPETMHVSLCLLPLRPSACPTGAQITLPPVMLYAAVVPFRWAILTAGPRPGLSHRW